jgi:hypothetical protein
MCILTDYAPDGDLENYLKDIFETEDLPKGYLRIFTMIILSI